MQLRLSLVTLGVADVARSRRFYEAMGLVASSASQEDVTFFQLGNVVLALFGRAALAADPGNFTLQLALARSLAAAGEFEPALQQALSLVQDDRHKTGEEARALMVDIFRLLPEDSELTSTYRRKLSTALY